MAQASKPGGNFERISKELTKTRMGYGVRNDKEEISELMRAANTAEDAKDIGMRLHAGVQEVDENGIVLDEKQQLKKICEERLKEFE